MPPGAVVLPSFSSHHAIQAASSVNSFVTRHAPELHRNTLNAVELVPNVIEEPFVAALSFPRIAFTSGWKTPLK